MKLFVLGANGRTGTQIVELALSRGHEVTAFVRSPQKLSPSSSLTIVRGDPQRPETIAAALPGHDAVLSAIGPHPRDALRPSTLLADCARDRGGDDSQRSPSTRHCFRRSALPGERSLLRLLSMASQTPRARSGRDGGPGAGERPRLDDCAAASIDEFTRRQLPRASGRSAAWKSRNVFPIGRGLHAGGGGAPVTSNRSRRAGIVIMEAY